MSDQLSAMPRYEVYKDSSVAWLGKIPEHWDVMRFRNLFSFGKGLNITKENLQDAGIPCVNYGEVHSKYGFEVNPDKHLLKCVSEDYLRVSSKSLLFAGDFVFADTSEDIEGAGNFTQLVGEHRIFAGYHTVIARPVRGNDCRFLAYVFESISYRNQIRSRVKGVKVYSITKAILKDTSVWLPSYKEQTAIATFLDRKTTQIDQAVATKEQQIALLKEWKQILIQNAVTRGLNSDAPMRNSSVEWIGEIPMHWGVLPGLCVFSENKRTNKGMIENQVLSLSYGKIIIKPEEKLNGLVPESFETYQVVEPGDIIVRCIDLQNDKTSLRTGIAKDKGIITSAYLNLGTKGVHNPEFMHYFLHVLDLTKEIYKYGSGLRQNLSFLDFKRMPVLDVPLQEQDEIVTYIETELAKIDKGIALQQQQIYRLKEYKSTIINSAVTGKIKVPELSEEKEA